MRKFRYRMEALFLLFGLLLFRLLPLDAASAVGGFLGRLIGPFTRAHTIASRNMEQALPELSESTRQATLRAMWDNLGRTIGEYPHLGRPIMRSRVTIEGREYLDAIRDSGKASIFVSGHFANWEIIPLTAYLYGLPLVLLYRAPNNPYADRIVRHIRGGFSAAMYNKGRAGAAGVIRALKDHQPIAMLVDQKLGDGKPIDFFGRPAMTPTAPADLAIRFGLPLVQARLVRTGGAYFHATVEPPLYPEKDADPIAVMRQINASFESWIRDHPAQWFWVHNRWGGVK